ncbi:MAG TPA: YoaK family protein [Jatrophihabitantaceae bacterium]|jgi:uncharacterized membrane protein YoaK (UPF0700 family)
MEQGRGAPVRRLVADPAHGPLPVLLLVLTVLTGVVDAVSILALGRVFVANMTGNVVFVGFALVGAPGFSLAASLIGLAGFVVGAGVGGQLTRRFGTDRGRLLGLGAGLELILFAAATVLVAAVASPIGTTARDVTVAILAIGTGTQNAVVRRLAVPDLTTTVLTMTLTGLAADLRNGAKSEVLLRRGLAVLTMLGGAVAGAELVLHASVTAALSTATALLAVVTAGAWAASARPAAWRNPPNR